MLLAAPLSRASLLGVSAREGHLETSVHWNPSRGRLCAERIRRLGAIELERLPWSEPHPEQVQATPLNALSEHGLRLLPWERSTRALQARLTCLHTRLGEPWPDRSDARLLETLGE